ncbi:MAG: hypothetical protein H5T72_05445 [Actinobacteria bacterium]|nr:hypothetical protein [Actinomycetota bacterium]
MGAKLKSAGFDGIVVQGESERPVYLLVEEGRAELRHASHLWGKGAAEVREILKSELGRSTGVVATGIAGENGVVFAGLLADDDSSGSGGLGAVMGRKRLKAVAVRGEGKVAVADPRRLEELRKSIRAMGGGSPIPLVVNPQVKPFLCYGCARGCVRSIYRAPDGRKGKVMCQSGLFYQSRPPEDFALPRGRVTSAGEWDEVAFAANRLCDDYGVDTKALKVIINWLASCYQAGILGEEEAGLPPSRVGSLEFIEDLVRKVSLRHGFGDPLARGSARATEEMGREASSILENYTIRAGQDSAYDPRLYLVTGLLYAMETRQPIRQLHEVFNPLLSWLLTTYGLPGTYATGEVIRAMARRFWGSEEAADFSTYEGKALAAKKIQDCQYANECLILCNFAWPLMFVEGSPDHVGDLGMESRVYSAVTGKEMDEEGLYRVGERIFNLQWAILAREGRAGRESDILHEAEQPPHPHRSGRRPGDIPRQAGQAGRQPGQGDRQEKGPEGLRKGGRGPPVGHGQLDLPGLAHAIHEQRGGPQDIRRHHRRRAGLPILGASGIPVLLLHDPPGVPCRRGRGPEGKHPAYKGPGGDGQEERRRLVEQPGEENKGEEGYRPRNNGGEGRPRNRG